MEYPSNKIFNIMGKKWEVTIIDNIYDHPCCGFNDLLRNIHFITPKILSTGLKMLESEHFIEKKVRSMSPLRISYMLTSKGEEFEILIQAIKKLNKVNYPSPASFKCKEKSCVYACPYRLPT